MDPTTIPRAAAVLEEIIIFFVTAFRETEESTLCGKGIRGATVSISIPREQVFEYVVLSLWTFNVFVFLNSRLVVDFLLRKEQLYAI